MLKKIGDDHDDEGVEYENQYLFIFHNLDCTNFYSMENLDYFSRIADMPNVIFVATLDSINFSKMMIT